MGPSTWTRIIRHQTCQTPRPPHMGTPVRRVAMPTPREAQVPIITQPSIYCNAMATVREQLKRFCAISRYSAESFDIAMAPATRNGLMS
mmetsp:Transcript_4837/g.12123  ORF Transcript_4837/g.12123 Transcript_4837/m.12123 type:complete len:89 (+) Transcript_4837:213-479(+)